MIIDNGDQAIDIWFILLIILLINEVRKALLILIKNQFHLLFPIQFSLLILRLYPGEKQEKNDEVVDNYKKHIKLYSILTLIAAAVFILISLW